MSQDDVMDRLEIIRSIIKARQFKSYLEIGVGNGRVFHQVRAWRKVAVDPVMNVDESARQQARRRRPLNLLNCYHKVTSDDYFSRLGKGKIFDLVFIDGLHTYAQCLRDCENALRHLAPGGMILLHDCNPQSSSSAWPANSFEDAERQNLDGWNGEWCGDVWKTVVHLRARREDLQVSVLDCDFGVGVVTRSKNEPLLKNIPEDIGGLPYEFLAANRRELLGLRELAYLETFLRAD